VLQTLFQKILLEVGGVLVVDLLDDLERKIFGAMLVPRLLKAGMRAAAETGANQMRFWTVSRVGLCPIQVSPEVTQRTM
jgi:hypothetical protein